MRLGQVIGTVTSTAKHPGYHGHKLMIVQPIDASGASNGESQLAIDTVQAGPGDTVLVLREGTGVRQILKEGTPPVRSLIVGIVDAVTIE